MPIDPDRAILANLVRNMKNSEQDALTPLIDRYYLERERSTTRLQEVTVPLVSRPRPGGRLSPSSMGGCQRQAAFKFLGMRGQLRINPEQEAIFDDGNWRHHKWQAIFKDMEYVLGRKKFRLINIERDVKIRGLYIAGSLDAEVWIKGVGRGIVDIKGINSFGFQRITQTAKPIEKHIGQLITYEKARRIYNGWLLYDCKDNNRYRSFIIRWTPELWADMEAWAERTLWYMERHKLPPKAPECEGGNFLYDRCPYANHCYGNKSNAEIETIAYRKFNDVENAWNQGNREAQADDSAQ